MTEPQRRAVDLVADGALYERAEAFVQHHGPLTDPRGERGGGLRGKSQLHTLRQLSLAYPPEKLLEHIRHQQERARLGKDRDQAAQPWWQALSREVDQVAHRLAGELAKEQLWLADLDKAALSRHLVVLFIQHLVAEALLQGALEKSR